MKTKFLMIIFSFLTMVGCGAPTDEDSKSNMIEEKDFDFEEAFLPDLDLTTAGGEIKFSEEGFILDQSSFPACLVGKGISIKFRSISKVSDGYRYVVLDGSRSVCGMKSGKIAQNLMVLSFEGKYSLVTKNTTYFKLTTAQSSTLIKAKEKCLIPKNTKLYLTNYGLVADDKVHIKVNLKESISGCDFVQGYFYLPHLSQVSKSKVEADFSFPSVMKHILKWEGGCSDHPNDPGGRTFMGITTYRAQLNGFYDDVCTMPKSMVLDIYRKDYWNNRAKNYLWPLNLAVMNTEVNSGGGRAQQFINRMRDWNIEGSTSEKASWFVDQQTNFYYLIAERNSRLRVFLRGWINRSNYMQDVISGRVSLVSKIDDSSAKTSKH